MNQMKFTKAQQEILNALVNEEEVYNITQRMRAIQPLIDAGLVRINYQKDKDGFDYIAGLILL